MKVSGLTQSDTTHDPGPVGSPSSQQCMPAHILPISTFKCKPAPLPVSQFTPGFPCKDTVYDSEPEGSLGNSDTEVDSDADLLDVEWNTTNWSQAVPISSIRQNASGKFLRKQARKARGHFMKGDFSVKPEVYKDIVQVAGITPTLDVFASKHAAKLPKFWTPRHNAFKQDWSNDILWMCPPPSKLEQVVEHIFLDQAQGILLVPVWPKKAWFQALSRIAVYWQDFHPSQELFQDGSGKSIPQRSLWTWRMIVFNAFGQEPLGKEPQSSDEEDNPPQAPDKLLMEQIKSMLDKPKLVEVLQHRFGKDSSKVVNTLLNENWDCPTQSSIIALRGVIESGAQHPESGPYVAKILELFDSELNEPKLAKDVDESLRGPYGVARIDLIDGAVPLAKRPFRTLGERELALKGFIEKFKERGWIRDSKSPWAAQAFIVPKPPKLGVKQWRLVVDYRYLNSQTKELPFPLPLIENLIGQQSLNRIWSILDLEDGFHQMHLDEDSRQYTAFTTPWGHFEWTVLPMGVKNGPSLFQRMIQWILQDVENAVAYIDDVLIGSSGSTPLEILKNHFRDCSNVLNAFRRHKITAKGSKVHLFMTMIKFCGHILSSGQRRAAPSKLEAIRSWEPEMVKTITHLRGFLGLAQYYSQYVKDFAMLCHPLTEQLKHRSAGSNKKIFWSDEMRDAFTKVKNALLENVILDIANLSKPFTLRVDASQYAIGGVLSQEDPEGNERPVAFFSRKLEGGPGKGQWLWATREKETYAIVCILKKFRPWVAGTTVLIKSDHKSLESWYKEDLNRWLGRLPAEVIGMSF